MYMHGWMDVDAYKVCMYYVYMHYAYICTCVSVGMQTEVTNLIESDRVEHKAEIHTHYG